MKKMKNNCLNNPNKLTTYNKHRLFHQSIIHTLFAFIVRKCCDKQLEFGVECVGGHPQRHFKRPHAQHTNTYPNEKAQVVLVRKSVEKRIRRKCQTVPKSDYIVVLAAVESSLHVE